MWVVKVERFSSSYESWPVLCAKAQDFATRVGRDSLINISVSDQGNGLGSVGNIFVWYWAIQE